MLQDPNFIFLSQGQLQEVASMAHIDPSESLRWVAVAGLGWKAALHVPSAAS